MPTTQMATMLEKLSDGRLVQLRSVPYIAPLVAPGNLSPFPSQQGLATGTYNNDGATTLGLFLHVKALRSGMTLTAVRFFMTFAGNAGSTVHASPRVYSTAGSLLATSVAAAADVSAPGSDKWTTMTLDTPYAISLNEEVYFGVYLTDFARYTATSTSFASATANADFTTVAQSTGNAAKYNYASDSLSGGAGPAGDSSGYYGVDLVYTG